MTDIAMTNADVMAAMNANPIVALSVKVAALERMVAERDAALSKHAEANCCPPKPGGLEIVK